MPFYVNTPVACAMSLYHHLLEDYAEHGTEHQFCLDDVMKQVSGRQNCNILSFSPEHGKSMIFINILNFKGQGNIRKIYKTRKI